ncbi:MAG: tetratricopeptide repeat protein, partial [Pseudomonadota bacterium]
RADALPDDHYRLAVLLQDAGDQRRAETHYRYALDTQSTPDAWLGLGNALRAQGRLSDAVDAYRQGLNTLGSARGPASVALTNNLGGVLIELEDYDGAESAYRDTVAADPNHVSAWSNLGLVHQRQTRFEESAAAFKRALEITPSDPRAALAYGHARQLTGDLDAAESGFRDALAKLSPNDPYATDLRGKLIGRLADVALRRQDAGGALAFCDEQLVQFPGDASTLAVAAICANEADAIARRDRLLAFDHLVLPYDVANVERNGASLNQALSTYVVKHPSLDYAPDQHATRKGMHSGDLFVGDDDRLIAHLADAIWDAAGQFVARLAAWDASHPTLTTRPPRSRLRIWGVVMRSGGHQIPHIHPAAWLSGVYYPQLPPFVADQQNDNAQLGWIEFGRSPDEFFATRPMPTRTFRPQEGRMFLFPGYFYHRTIPFDADAERISIAFDFVPGDERAV